VSVAHEVGEYVRRQINLNHPEVSEVFIHIGIEHAAWRSNQLIHCFSVLAIISNFPCRSSLFTVFL